VTCLTEEQGRAVVAPRCSPFQRRQPGRRLLVLGDRVIVRGEVRGTPSGDLFGVPHSGKSFQIMAIDIQTIRDGKIAKTFHTENCLSTIDLLRAKSTTHLDSVMEEPT
jgi:ketosteroid isomerase-like protein